MSCGFGILHGPVQSGQIKVVRAGCKKLSCPRCGPKRADMYREAISRWAVFMNLTRFLTLTLDPRKVNGDSVTYIRTCWAKFRVSLLRRYGKSVTYIAVVELHRSGVAHLHIMVDRYIPQEWICSAWQAVGGGYKVDIRFVDTHRISSYLSKYLTRDLFLSVPPRKKRISTSRDIVLLLLVRKPASGWNYSPMEIDDALRTIDGVILEVRDGPHLEAFYYVLDGG